MSSDAEFGTLLEYARSKIAEAEWHWLSYHFLGPRVTLAAEAIIAAAVDCGLQVPGLEKNYIDRIANVRDRNKEEDDYQTILQILSEMLCVRQLFCCMWAPNPQIDYEPAGRSGKRPEIVVRSKGQRFLFEVKAPGLLRHQRERAINRWQVPNRAFSRESLEMLAGGETLTLPRDNPVKDFLLSADGKFSDFDCESGANILIVVWDDHVYEPITTLVHSASGLLTPQSYFKDEVGNPVRYEAVDGVVILRHLNYFVEGLAERVLPDRRNLLDFGGKTALPNVFVPTQWGRHVPEFILSGLRAIDYRDDRLQCMAEYVPQDLVMWVL